MKTTITAIVGAVAMLAAIFGFQVNVETQVAIVTVVIFVIGILAKDGGNTPTAA